MPVTTQTSSSAASPWAAQQPYLQEIFNKAQTLYNAPPPAYYPGSTVTPYSQETEQALSMQANRARAGSPTLQQGQQLLGQTMGGQFLGANPYLQQMTETAMGQARQGVDTQFAGSGRYGSGLHKTALGETFGNIAGNIYGNAYETERGRQQQALSMAPQYAQADYQDPAMLANVGAQREKLSQAQLLDEVSRYNYGQNIDRQMLADYLKMIQGNYGGQTTGTQQTPYFENQTAGILGGGLAGANLGYGVGNALGGYGGYGALIGAIGGGLLGA